MPAVSPPLLESTPPPSSLATGRQYRVAVIGNPNTGKTTLFNALDGAEPAHRELPWGHG